MKTENIARCIFIVEGLAHLQGKERDLLPIVEAARAELDALVKHDQLADALSSPVRVKHFAGRLT